MSLIFRPDRNVLRKDKRKAESAYAFSPSGRSLAEEVELLSIRGQRREAFLRAGRGRWIALTEGEARGRQREVWRAGMLETNPEMLRKLPPLFGGEYWWDEVERAWSYVPQLGPKPEIPRSFGDRAWYDEQANQWYDIEHPARGPVPARQPTEEEALEQSVSDASRHAADDMRRRRAVVFSRASERASEQVSE